MFKKISVLVMPLLCAGMNDVLAQSSVTIYGIADVGMAYINNVNGGSASQMYSGGLQSSRLGFRGNEDLGGGLNAVFTLESGLDMDTGSVTGAAFWGRQAFMGLSSRNWGSITLGRQYTPSYDYLVLAGFAPAFGGLAAAHDGVPGSPVGQQPAAAVSRFNNGIAAHRIDNSIKYASPSFGGFSFSALYGFGEVPGDNSAGRTLAVAGTYKSGKSFVSASYTETASRISSSEPRDRIYAIGGMYDFGKFSITAKYSVQKNSRNIKGMNADVGSIFVTVPIDRLELKAGYSRMNDKSPTDYDSDQYALGAIYYLSKRTSLYSTLAYQRVGNGGLAGQNFNLSGNGRQTQILFGVRQVF